MPKLKQCGQTVFMLCVIFCTMIVLCVQSCRQDSQYSKPVTLNAILDAIQHVETGGEPDPANARGAHNELGWMQITRPYYIDAAATLKHVGIAPPPYEIAATDWWWSRQLVIAYWIRHCPEAMTGPNPKVLAEHHNGGPSGKAVATYWPKVRNRLQIAGFYTEE